MRLQTVQNLRAAFGLGHHVQRPMRWRAPVVFASPHSGAIYPRAFRMASSLSLSDLRRNEDAYVDVLFGAVPNLGAPLLTAQFPRSFVDVNRPEDDLPPDWVTPGLELKGPKGSYRARMGLGVVPTVVGENMTIFRKPPNARAVQARLEALYRPYHGALWDLVHQARSQFGQALLLDCHSMPGFAPRKWRRDKEVSRGARRPDIILGDGHGRTARAETVDYLQALFERAGYEVARNHPYAGGYATLHYGRPEQGIEAIQIEINRDLYLQAGTRLPTRGPGFEDLQRDLSQIAKAVIAWRMPRAVAEAAE